MSILALAVVLASNPAPEPTATEPPDLLVPAVDETTVPLADAMVVRAGATCLERDRLVEQIRTWFDHERVDERLVIEVVGDSEDPRKLAFTLRLGERVISVRRFDPAPDRCADLHAVVGLAIALAIDATLLDAVAGDPTRPLRPPDPPPYQPEPIETAPPTFRAKPRRWSVWAEVAGQLSIGAPPDIGGGGRVGLFTSWRRIVDFGVSAIAGSSGRARIGEGRALLSLVGARFDICGGPPWARVRPRGCVGLIGGAAFAAGQGFDDDRTVRVAYLSIPFGVDLEIRLARRVNLLLGIEGLPSVIRPAFTADSQSGVRSTRRFARFGTNVEAGLEFKLW